MLELLSVGVIGLLILSLAAVFSSRLGVAAPLILVGIGILGSLLPFIPNVEIDPELILAGLLPPLLYASAVSMPTMNFRRDFGAISGLSVVLVILSAVVVGALFALFVPGVNFVWGVALGAIISPTDAVATSIIKKAKAPQRVVVLLDGESLLNDATALVLLRTAVIASAAGFSFWPALGTFVYSVVVAIIIGFLVGWLSLKVRSRITDATVNTILSFTVPFVASIPTELLGSSGLVAAVVAGLYTGVRAPRMLRPEHRMSDSQNWATLEFVAEGSIFLLMGLQLSEILAEVRSESMPIWIAGLIALGALAAVTLVRAAFVTPLIGWLGLHSKRGEKIKKKVAEAREKTDFSHDPEAFLNALAAQQDHRGPDRHRGVQGRGHGRAETEGIGDAALDRTATPAPPGGGQLGHGPRGGAGGPARRGIRSPADLQKFASRFGRMMGDIHYITEQKLGRKEGTLVVWAGMRGAVTVAAAQTLPLDTPHRALLVFIAFAVATFSLLIQGGTVGALVKKLYADEDTGDDAEQSNQQRQKLGWALDITERNTEIPADTSERDARILVIEAQRTAILDARDAGIFDPELLSTTLRTLDAKQIALEMRVDPQD